MRSVAKVPYLSLAFWGWVASSSVATLVSAYSGQYWDLMSQSVELTGLARGEPEHVTMVWSFIIISIGVFIISVAIGALLVWRTNLGNSWAKYMLTVFAVFQLYLQISAIIAIQLDYAYDYGLIDWVITPLSVFLLFYVGFRPYWRKSSDVAPVT